MNICSIPYDLSSEISLYLSLKNLYLFYRCSKFIMLNTRNFFDMSYYLQFNNKELDKIITQKQNDVFYTLKINVLILRPITEMIKVCCLANNMDALNYYLLNLKNPDKSTSLIEIKFLCNLIEPFLGYVSYSNIILLIGKYFISHNLKQCMNILIKMYTFSINNGNTDISTFLFDYMPQYILLKETQKTFASEELPIIKCYLESKIVISDNIIKSVLKSKNIKLHKLIWSYLYLKKQIKKYMPPTYRCAIEKGFSDKSLLRLISV